VKLNCDIKETGNHRCRRDINADRCPTLNTHGQGSWETLVKVYGKDLCQRVSVCVISETTITKVRTVMPNSHEPRTGKHSFSPASLSVGLQKIAIDSRKVSGNKNHHMWWDTTAAHLADFRLILYGLKQCAYQRGPMRDVTTFLWLLKIYFKCLCIAATYRALFSASVHIKAPLEQFLSSKTVFIPLTVLCHEKLSWFMTAWAWLYTFLSVQWIIIYEYANLTTPTHLPTSRAHCTSLSATLYKFVATGSCRMVMYWLSVPWNTLRAGQRKNILKK